MVNTHHGHVSVADFAQSSCTFHNNRLFISTPSKVGKAEIVLNSEQLQAAPHK